MWLEGACMVDDTRLVPWCLSLGDPSKQMPSSSPVHPQQRTVRDTHEGINIYLFSQQTSCYPELWWED